MSTLHKVKAYFGMAPMEDYDDEYYEDDGRAARGYGRRSDRFAEDEYERFDRDRDYEDPRGPRVDHDDFPPGSYRGSREYAEEPRFRPREFERSHDMG
ncbi:MAG TPA: cell division protein SepF, partial [Mycobacterium sp.]|nr:cell division protein SepF [Mycobacterium sp.]